MSIHCNLIIMMTTNVTQAPSKMMLKIVEKNVDIIFAPKLNISDEFDNNKNIDLPKFTRYLCGASRANHFSGVYKIVKYLFSIIEPNFACFGKKIFNNYY